MGHRLKELIGGSKGLPYLKDPRYKYRPPQNMSRKDLEDELEKQEIIAKENDLLYRKCSGFPFVKMFSSQLSNQIK